MCFVGPLTSRFLPRVVCRSTETLRNPSKNDLGTFQPPLSTTADEHRWVTRRGGMWSWGVRRGTRTLAGARATECRAIKGLSGPPLSTTAAISTFVRRTRGTGRSGGQRSPDLPRATQTAPGVSVSPAPRAVSRDLEALWGALVDHSRHLDVSRTGERGRGGLAGGGWRVTSAQTLGSVTHLQIRRRRASACLQVSRSQGRLHDRWPKLCCELILLCSSSCPGRRSGTCGHQHCASGHSMFATVACSCNGCEREPTCASDWKHWDV
jgi:hypothetical protein